MWQQHVIVLAVVAACVSYVVRQGVRTLRGQGGRIGRCCSKGCGNQELHRDGERVVFLPSDSLRRRK